MCGLVINFNFISMTQLNFYEPIYDITADAGVRVKGKDLKQVLCNLIFATINEMVELPKIEPKQELTIKVSSIGFPYLLADVVNKILYLFEVKKFIPAQCEVLELSPEGTTVTILLKGEKYNPQKHGKKLLIKAATYHKLSLKKKDKFFEAEVIFDI